MKMQQQIYTIAIAAEHDSDIHKVIDAIHVCLFNEHQLETKLNSRKFDGEINVTVFNQNLGKDKQ